MSFTLQPTNVNTLTSAGIEWLTPSLRETSSTYEVPQGLAVGYYFVRFQGSNEKQPGTLESGDLEAFRIRHESDDGHEIERPDSYSFTFSVPDCSGIELKDLPEPYRNPTSVVWRQSTRPFYLVPGDRIKVELRYPYALLANVGLVPAAPDRCIVVSAQGVVENNIFTDRSPPEFSLSLENRGKENFDGTLTLTMGDSLTGEEKSRSKPVTLLAGKKTDLHESFRVLNGVYYLKIDLYDKSGELVTQLWRYFSYSPYIDAHDLPMDWPFGFHIKSEDPLPPPVGLKWVRIFRPGWYELQPEEDSIDWSSMDDQVQRCKEAGHPILYIGMGVPQWARPGSPDSYRAFAKYPPSKEGALEDFLRAFWNRYAPGGKLDTVRAIEIFNEANAKDYFRYNYAEYVKYAKIIYETTKEIAPDATVVGISLSGGLHEHFVEGVLDAGLGQYMDVASLHLYEIGTPLGEGPSLDAKIRMFKKQLAAHGLADMPIWNSESGGKLSIRNNGVILPQEKLNDYYRQHSTYNPKRAWVVDNHWVEVSESLVSAWIIRGSLQQLAEGVQKNFYFQWTNGPHGWVTDWGPEGNPMPRLKIRAQAVLSQLWRDYGGMDAETLNLPSPDPEFWLLSYRYQGQKGRMTALFTHPYGADRGSEDAVASLATGQHTNYDGTTVRYDPYTRKVSPPSISVRVPVSSSEVVVVDWLDRHRETLKAIDGHVTVNVGETPMYLLETKADNVK